MTKEELKNKLLDADNLVIDNEYLDKYIDLIIENQDKKYSKKNRKELLIDKHHKVPKYYFKEKGLPIDESRNNLVYIAFENHVYLHYYLYKCSNSEKFKYYNLLAMQILLTGQKVFKRKITAEEVLNSLNKLEDYKELKKKQREIDSMLNTGCLNGMYGKKHSEETKEKIAHKQREYQKTHMNNAQRDDVKEKLSMVMQGHSVSDECKVKIRETLKEIITIHKDSDEIKIDRRYLNEFKDRGYSEECAKSHNKSKPKSEKRVRYWVKYKDMVKIVNNYCLDSYIRAGFIKIKKPKRVKNRC